MSAEEVKPPSFLVSACQLADEVQRLLDGPPNGRHLTTREWIAQWVTIQQRLDQFRAAQRGDTP